MWEGVGERTELQHIDPHSYGHNSVSFPFSWAAQLVAWWPSLSGCWFSHAHLIPNWLNFLCTELYNCSTSTFFFSASQIALIPPFHGQRYILIFCYLHRCISYFDSLAGLRPICNNCLVPCNNIQVLRISSKSKPMRENCSHRYENWTTNVNKLPWTIWCPRD